MAVNFSLLFSQPRPGPCDKSKTFLKYTSQFVGRISHLQSHTLSPHKWKIIQLVMLFMQTSQEQYGFWDIAQILNCKIQVSSVWWQQYRADSTTASSSSLWAPHPTSLVLKKNRGIFQSINLWCFFFYYCLFAYYVSPLECKHHKSRDFIYCIYSCILNT